MLYRHGRTLPFTVRLGRTIGFSAVGIERYVRQRAYRVVKEKIKAGPRPRCSRGTVR